MNLDELLICEKTSILDEAVSAMERVHLTHYQEAGPGIIRERLERLYDLVAKCAKEKKLMALITYIRMMARERFHDGFDLQETQTAINVLEEALWKRIIRELKPDSLAFGLGMIGTILGAAKDHLAQTYVALASNHNMPSLDLKALFIGSEGNPSSH